MTPIHKLALWLGLLAAVSAGAQDLSPNAQLLVAARQGHTEVVELLLAAGESPRAAYRNDLTALMWAAAYGHAGTVKLLLGRGADANARDNRGKTALAMAVEGRHEETAQLLRKAGAAE